jgi:hypothetical protein
MFSVIAGGGVNSVGMGRSFTLSDGLRITIKPTQKRAEYEHEHEYDDEPEKAEYEHEP